MSESESEEILDSDDDDDYDDSSEGEERRYLSSPSPPPSLASPRHYGEPKKKKDEGPVPENYNAYDATSRSVPLALNESLLGSIPYSSSITREDVEVDGARVFLLHNFLSDEECDYLVNSTEAIGYDKYSDVKNEYPKDYRSNQRLIVLSRPLANTLWSRIQPQLHYKDIENIKPLGWATEGLWLPNQVNDGFLFSRYKQGNFFRPHYDGMYKNEFNECSIYSVTIYLNDNYSGGNVVFMKNKDSRDPQDILYTFVPKKGTALVFNHDTLHAGEEVTSGTKYLFRTGIMFKHIENLSDPKKGWESDPLWLKNREVFKTFSQLGKEGNPEKFTKTFLELQHIQLEHGRSIIPVTKVLLGLSEDLLFSVFSFLSVQEVLHLAEVCKSWMTISRNGILWRRLYAQTWGEAATKFVQDTISENLNIDPAIQQWCAIYRKRLLVESVLTPIVIYVSYDVNGCVVKGNETIYIKPFYARSRIDNSPWDNSYETYKIGEGEFWYKRNTVTFIYQELVRAATHRLNAADNKRAAEHRPYVFVVDGNAWNKEYEPKLIEYARRVLRAEAISIVEAPLASLYAHKLTQGITVGLEVLDTVCIRAWRDSSEIEHAKSTISISPHSPLPSPQEMANAITKLVLSTFEKSKLMSTVLVISENNTSRNVGKYYRQVIPILAKALEAQLWKVIICNEREILRGASVRAAHPSFFEQMHWKSWLYHFWAASKLPKKEGRYRWELIPLEDYVYGENLNRADDYEEDQDVQFMDLEGPLEWAKPQEKDGVTYDYFPNYSRWRDRREKLESNHKSVYDGKGIMQHQTWEGPSF